MTVRNFNRLCAAIVLLWLVGGESLLMIRRPNSMDFEQFYMGAVVARHGAWEAMYPDPLPGSWRNPGEFDTSTPKPRYEELARQHGAGQFTRFMQFPPVALLLQPLAYLSFPQARLVWTIVSALCGWIVTLQAARVLKLSLRRESIAVGILILIIGFSPNMFRAARAGQVSTIIGACIGLVVLDLLSRRPASGAIGLVLGGVLKYATAVLLPLHLALARWRTLLIGGILGSLILLGSLAVIGTGPFVEWTTKIAPLLDRSHDWTGNQSIHGLLLRLTDSRPLRPDLHSAVRVVMVVVGASILVLIALRRKTLEQHAAVLAAAAAALIAWMLIFSPIAWYHYYPYLFPLWGWLMWEWLEQRRTRPIILLIVLLAWWPICAEPSLNRRLGEPANSLMLFSNVLMLGLAMWRLAARPPRAAEPTADLQLAASQRPA